MELLNFKPPGLTGRHLPGCEVRFQSLRSREKENVDMVFIETKSRLLPSKLYGTGRPRFELAK